MKQLSIENAADILNLADIDSARQLKEMTIRFIIYNKSEVIETAAWNELRSELTAKLFKVEGATKKTANCDA